MNAYAASALAGALSCSVMELVGKLPDELVNKEHFYSAYASTAQKVAHYASPLFAFASAGLFTVGMLYPVGGIRSLQGRAFLLGMGLDRGVNFMQNLKDYFLDRNDMMNKGKINGYRDVKNWVVMVILAYFSSLFLHCIPSSHDNYKALRARYDYD